MSLIPVGPRLHVYQADDRWGVPVPHWYATDYGLIDEEKWARVQDYQTMPPLTGTRYATMEEAMASPLGKEVKRKLDLAGCRTVWEMDLIAVDDEGNPQEVQRGPLPPDSLGILLEREGLVKPLPRPDTFERVRQFAVFGEERLVRWSEYDIKVRLPRARKLAAAYTERGFRR